MQRRHALLLAAAGVAWAARPARAAPAPIQFRIMRKGARIGTHQVTFTEAQGSLSALTVVTIAVKLAGITVFHLNHRFEEVWQGERLQRATSHLDRNGRITDMTAHAEGGAILITGPDGPQRLPADAAPLTWWNPHQAERPLFDNDSGKPLKLQWTRTPLEGGAYRLACTGDSESAGTYAANDTWLAWTTKGDDGSVVNYERI